MRINPVLWLSAVTFLSASAWAAPSSPLSRLGDRLLMGCLNGYRAFVPHPLIKEAGSGQKERGLANNLAAALGLRIRMVDKNQYYAFKGSPSYGEPIFGSRNYYPESAGFFVPLETLDLVEKVMRIGRVPREFSEGEPVLQALLDYSQRGDTAVANGLLERIAELRQRPVFEIDGKKYVGIGPNDYGRESTVRLVSPGDWKPAPKVRENGLTGQPYLQGVQDRYGGKYRDFLVDPMVYTGGGTIGYARRRARIDGSNVYLITSHGAVSGVLRGHWSPGGVRGYPIDERLRYTSDLKGRVGYFFVETVDADGQAVTIAVDSNDPTLKIYSTAQPER